MWLSRWFPKGRYRGQAIVIAVPIALLIALAADQVMSSGFVTAVNRFIWDAPADEIGLAGGRWLSALLILIIREIPGATPAILTLITTAVAVTFAIMFVNLLLRRGWAIWEAVAFGLLVAIHPVTMYLATTGQPRLLAAAVFAAVVLACDRLEAIGDVQTQMALGLILGAMMLVDPNAIYVLLPLLVILPVFYREIRNAQSAVAAYLVVVMPSAIVVAAVAGIIVTLSNDSLTKVAAIWGSPFHGLAFSREAFAWPTVYGGRPFAAGAVLAGMMVVAFPPVLVLAARGLINRRERQRPGTALVALMIPVLSGMIATAFWHATGPWVYLSYALAALCVWIATSTIPPHWRQMLLAAMAIGVIATWTLPQFWTEPEKIAWREILIPGDADSMR